MVVITKSEIQVPKTTDISQNRGCSGNVNSLRVIGADLGSVSLGGED